MNKFYSNFFLILFFSPILSYIVYLFLGYRQYYHVLGMISIAVFFVYLLYPGRKKRLKFPMQLYPIYMLYFYYFVWNFFNGNVEEYGFIKSLFRDKILYTIAILILIENIYFSKKFIDNSIKLIKITILIAFIATIFQIISDTTFFVPIEIEKYVTTGKIYQNRIQSIFAYIDPNSLGISFLALFSIFLGYEILTKQKYPLYWVFMVGTVSLATNGRYIILNFFLILSQYFLSKRELIQKYFKIIFVYGTLLIVLYFIFSYFGYNFYEYGEKRLWADIESGTNTRLFAFKVFNKYFFEKPIIGTGVHLTDEIKTELTGRSSQIHVGYLSHLVSYGIVGSAFLFIFWFLLARRLFKTARKSSFYGSFFAFLGFLLANATFVYYPIFTYGLIFTFIFNKYFEDRFKYKSKYKALSKFKRIT